MTEPLEFGASDSIEAEVGVPDYGSNTRQVAVRSATLLSFRQILVGLVTVGAIVALPKLLTPAEFSLYGYVNTILLVGAALGDLGLGAFIIRSRVSDRDLSATLAIQIAFWFLICLLAAVVAALFAPFGFSGVTSALLIIGLLLFSLQALPTAVLEKQMRFRRISIIEVAQRVILVTVAIGLAVVKPSEWSIPLAAVVAGAVGYPMVMIAAGWRWPPRFKSGEPLFRGFSSQWWQVRITNQAAYAAYPLLGGLLYSANDVGLIVWALAITTIPAYLAPMVARATFPALAKSAPEHRAAIYSALFRGLLLIGGPLVAALLVTANPLTETVFGSAWLDGIPLLRLESVTSLIGIALSSMVPLLMLSLPVRTVKWIFVASTCTTILIAIALDPWLSYLSISIATIISTTVVLVTFDRMLSARISYSPLRDMLPSIAGVIVGVAGAFPIVSAMDPSLLAVLLAGSVAGAIQIAVVFLLGGGVSISRALTQMRAGA